MRGSGRQLDHAGLWVRNLLLPCCCGISLAFGLLRGSLGPQPKTWDSQGWDHCPAPASHPHLCHAVRKALCEARHRNMGNGDVPALSWLILCCSPVSIPPGVLCPPPLLALVSDLFCRDVQSSRFGDTGWAQLPWGVWGSGCIPLPGPAVGCQAWGSGLGGTGHQPASLQDASLLHHCCITAASLTLLHHCCIWHPADHWDRGWWPCLGLNRVRMPHRPSTKDWAPSLLPSLWLPVSLFHIGAWELSPLKP